MKKAKILIVEDESIVAMDIQSRLELLGYKVVGIENSGNEVIKNYSIYNPDLVLMDIHLNSSMDGIETAEIIKKEYDTPVIYITAYADKDTLKRAKITQPFGYILKPFQERELISNIEMALFKHAIEKELKQKEMLLSVTLGAINDGIITLDEDGKVLYQNSVARSLFGPMEHCDDIYSYTESRIIKETGKEVSYAKYSHIPVTVSVTRLEEPNLRIIMIRDYSDIISSETQLVNAKKLAEEVSEAKSNFMANMSHELRTPLNSIIGMTDLVMEHIEDNDLKEYLTIARHASDSLLSLINSILDFSKIEAGRMDLHHVSFDLDEIIENTLRKVSVDAYKKGIELRSNISKPLKFNYWGDPKRIFQILLNIVANAVKFTQQGFVDISRRVINDSETETEFEISITDSGIGISSEKLETIFDAFTQQDDSYTRIHGGTGLGLAIVRNLLSMMGGSISASSSAGNGSEFVIRIPFKKAEEREMFELTNEFGIWLVCKHTYLQRYFVECIETMGGKSHIVDLDELATISIPDKKENILFIEVSADLRRSVNEIISEMDKKFSRCVLIDKLGGSGLKLIKDVHPNICILLYPFKRVDLFSRIAGNYDKPNANVSEKFKTKQTGKTILLAEDDMNNQILIKRIFDKSGYNVVIANNGDEAIRLYKEIQPHIVLMDVQMPKKDGIETTKAIRTIPGTLYVPILALTAHAMDGFKEQCLEAGMDDYISKPFKAPELIEKVETLLYRKVSITTAKKDKKLTGVEKENLSRTVIVYKELLDSFLVEPDYNQIILTAGYLKNDAKQYSLKKLESLCFKIVLAGRNENIDRLTELIAGLQDYI